MLAPWNIYDKPKQRIKKQRHHFADKDLYSQSYGFSSSHVWMWEWDYNESWAPKNLCFWTMVLEKTLESSLDCKEIRPVNPKGNLSLIFIRRTRAEADAPIPWLPNENNWFIGLIHWVQWFIDSLKRLMLVKIEGRRRRGWQRTRWLDGIIDSLDMSLSKLREMVKHREAWHAVVHGVAKSQTRWNDWETTLSMITVTLDFQDLVIFWLQISTLWATSPQFPSP